MTIDIITRLESADGPFYTKPDGGWTCFHCGETFTTVGAARDHFGFQPSQVPGCIIKAGAERGLLMALRKAERELSDLWVAVHNESTEAAKAYYAQMTRHNAQLMAAEESGYERGLADALAAAALHQREAADQAPAPPQKQEGTDMNQIEKVARAAAWLRECHDWLLSNDLDMCCPMVENPLDLAEELEAIAAMPVPAEPVAWRYTRADGHFFLAPNRCRAGYPEADGWTETPLYAGPTPPAGGSDAAS